MILPSNVMKISTQGFTKIINGVTSFEGASTRKLMSANPASKKYAQPLSSPLNEEMTTDSSTQEVSEDPGAVQLMKMVLSGQYTYLTYMLLSTTCFFFWLMPNSHKIRKMFTPHH